MEKKINGILVSVECVSAHKYKSLTDAKAIRDTYCQNERTIASINELIANVDNLTVADFKPTRDRFTNCIWFKSEFLQFSILFSDACTELGYSESRQLPIKAILKNGDRYYPIRIEAAVKQGCSVSEDMQHDEFMELIKTNAIIPTDIEYGSSLTEKQVAKLKSRGNCIEINRAEQQLCLDADKSALLENQLFDKNLNSMKPEIKKGLLAYVEQIKEDNNKYKKDLKFYIDTIESLRKELLDPAKILADESII